MASAAPAASNPLPQPQPHPQRHPQPHPHLSPLTSQPLPAPAPLPPILHPHPHPPPSHPSPLPSPRHLPLHLHRWELGRTQAYHKGRRHAVRSICTALITSSTWPKCISPSTCTCACCACVREYVRCRQPEILPRDRQPSAPPKALTLTLTLIPSPTMTQVLRSGRRL